MPQTLEIIAPEGVDWSGLGLPYVEDLIEGFGSDNLAALYLFEDQTVGVAYAAPVIDSSGNGNDGTLALNSQIIRTAAGVQNHATTANDGWEINTGITCDGSFSAVIVTRNRGTPSTAGARPWIHFASHQLASVANTNSVSYSNTYGTLALIHDNNDAETFAEISLWARKSTGAGAGAMDGMNVGGIEQVDDAAEDKDAWIAVGWSVDATTGKVIVRALGTTFTLTDLTSVTTFLGGGGTHMFGHLAASSGNNALGDAGLYVLWNDVAKDVAELDREIANAQAIMDGRGETVL